MSDTPGHAFADHDRPTAKALREAAVEYAARTREPWYQREYDWPRLHAAALAYATAAAPAPAAPTPEDEALVEALSDAEFVVGQDEAFEGTEHAATAETYRLDHAKANAARTALLDALAALRRERDAARARIAELEALQCAR